MPDRTDGIVGGRMPVVRAPVETASDTRPSVGIAAIAWKVAAVYYFYRYVQRSSPSIVMPQLSEASGLSTFGVDNAISKEAAETKRTDSEVAGDLTSLSCRTLRRGTS